MPAGSHVIHVGDFAPLGGKLEDVLPAELHDRFWFVPGNHDFDSPEHFGNVNTDFAQARCFHLKIIQIGDLRIAGAGRIFSQKTWYPREELSQGLTTREQALRNTPKRDRFLGGLTLRQQKYLFEEDFKKLGRGSAHVLVTHEAPSSHKHGFVGIDELARRLGVHTVVHGHHHEDYVGKTRNGIDVVGVGLRGGWSI